MIFLMRNKFLFVLLMFYSLASSADVDRNKSIISDVVPPTYCFESAAYTYKIDPLLLIAIAEVESSLNSKAIGQNIRKGKVVSEDVGLMQINSSWFPFLKSNWGITRQDLVSNPCQNIYVGAYILAKNLSSNGVTWNSIGAYNAGFKEANEAFRQKYSKKVYDKYIYLLGRNRQQVIVSASNGRRTY